MAARRRARASPRPRRRTRGTVVPATLGDLAVLVRHRRAMWEAIGRGTPRQLAVHDRVYRRWVRAEWAAGRFAAFLVRDRDGPVLGSGAVWLVPAQPRPGPRIQRLAPYILSMYTDPAARGLGVASRIVRALVGWARARGYPRVTLHASKMGRGVYERLGFRTTNEMRYTLRGSVRARGPARR